MNNPINHLNIDGSTVRKLGNEAVQALWNLTTDKHSAKVNIKVDVNLEEFFTKENYTLRSIIELLDKYHPEAKVKYKGMDTTLGRVIFNEVIFNHIPIHKFINATMTNGDIHGTINTYASYLLDKHMNDKFNMDMYLNMLDKMHDLGFGICDVVASSLDYKMLVAHDQELEDMKAKEMKRLEGLSHEDKAKTMIDIEENLVKFMKNHYKDNQMADLYDSGAKPKWDNDLKMVKVALGVVPVPGTGEIHIVESSLKEGLKNKDILANANMQINGAYNRAVMTAQGGYLTKKMYNAFQSTVIYKGDCGVKKYLKKIENNKKDLLFRYVKTPKGEELITTENIDQYLGKEVEIRSPLFCKHKEGYCTKCTGEMLPILYKMDEKGLKELNVGLFIADIGNEVLNKFMKKTHDMRQKLYTIEDLDDFVM